MGPGPWATLAHIMGAYPYWPEPIYATNVQKTYMYIKHAKTNLKHTNAYETRKTTNTMYSTYRVFISHATALTNWGAQPHF